MRRRAPRVVFVTARLNDCGPPRDRGRRPGVRVPGSTTRILRPCGRASTAGGNEGLGPDCRREIDPDDLMNHSPPEGPGPWPERLASSTDPDPNATTAGLDPGDASMVDPALGSRGRHFGDYELLGEIARGG